MQDSKHRPIQTRTEEVAQMILGLDCRTIRTTHRHKSVYSKAHAKLNDPLVSLAEVTAAIKLLIESGKMEAKRRGGTIDRVVIMRSAKQPATDRTIQPPGQEPSFLDGLWRTTPVPPRHMHPLLRLRVNSGLTPVGAPRRIAA